MLDSEVFIANLRAELRRIAKEAEAIGSNKFKNEHRLAKGATRSRCRRYSWPPRLASPAWSPTSRLSPPPWRSSLRPQLASMRCWTRPGAAGATRCSPLALSTCSIKRRVPALDVGPATTGSDRDADWGRLSEELAAELRSIVEGLAREETAIRSTRSEDATP